MQTIFRCLFGSHLYGTSTPASDVDWKEVFLPPARSILLGGGPETVSRKPKADDRSGWQRRNLPGEEETEAHSLRKILTLAAEGQTVALDMLFATPLVGQGQLPGRTSSIWQAVWHSRERLASRRGASFLAYCRGQANKYGIKGSRIAAADLAVAVLSDLISARGPKAKLAEVGDQLAARFAGVEHAEIVQIPQRDGSLLPHLAVCGCKAPYTLRLELALPRYQAILANCGHRARSARDNQGIDWKALSHAVRVGRQAIEYLGSGQITFPRPEAGRLLQIKLGLLPYQSVAEEIEALLALAEAAAASSPLPAAPDQEWIDGFIVEAYGAAVARAMQEGTC